MDLIEFASFFSRELGVSHGLYLETSESFDEGEVIAMTISFAHHSKPFKITGEIVRTTPQGIGVQFKTMSQIQEELIQNIVEQVKKFKK